MKTVCIIGGGPAGMMAAYAASENKNIRVRLFEKNDRLGRKLLITGKGRCNITNMGDLQEFMENIPHNGVFLYSAFSKFNNYDLIALMEENGLAVKVERGQRVFPVSDKAMDVVDFFVKLLKKRNVEICCKMNVREIIREDNRYKISFDGSDGQYADAVIIATGGLSYPQTGSSGDGYRLAKEMGHSVTKLYPSLVALRCEEDYPKALSGLSLKNVSITIKDMLGKKVYEDFGEMLFTHFGVSGPMILSASSRITKRVDKERFNLFIDLKPALDEKTLDKRLLKDFKLYNGKNIVNALCDLLPGSIIPIVTKLAEIDFQRKASEITKAERKALLGIIKALPLTITGTDGYNHAVVTYGGVNTDEINPKTMESKYMEKVYFAGELIDVDAYTGGFNLQIAFSTGFLAGNSAGCKASYKNNLR